MNSLFKGENLTFECRGCPQGINLQNTLNQTGKRFESKHQFKSISSNINNTNFATITKNQQVITYGWDGDQFNIFKSYKIDQIEYHCFNVFYTFDNSVLLDCYHQNKLLLCYLQNDTLIRVYNQQSQMPISTKIIQMINQTQVYTLYGQYYEDYQLLTLFKDKNYSFLNISTWQQGFQDFIQSQGLNRTNFIYLSNNTNLLQIIINESENFQILSQFNLNAEIKTFTVFSSLSKNSQCDQLIVLLDQELNKNLWHFLACQQLFIEYRNYRLSLNGLNTQNIQIFANDEFLILQLDQYISIRQIDFPERILKEAILEKSEKFNSTKFLYFDKSKSILFEFGIQLIAYLVAIPNLNGFFANNSISQNFTIYRTIFDLIDPRCQVQLQFILLSEKDSLIYQQFSSNPEKDYIVINKGYYQIIENYSGSLLKLQSQFSEQFVGEFESAVLQKVKQNFTKNFQLATMMYVNQNLPQLFIAGIIEQQIFFYLYTPQFYCQQNYQENLNQSNFQQIQMAYNSQGSVLIGVSFESNQIQLFSYNFTNFTINQAMIMIPPYKSFLLNYNCIIILTKRKEILVFSQDLNIKYHLKTDNIQQFYQEVILFRPVAIALNQQDQSSLLVIGNENQILIFSITNSAILIPICFQNLDLFILDIKLVKNKIIVIYNDYLLNVCFQVWEFVNLKCLNFQQNLRCISQIQYQTSYSDNQFFYVKLNSDNMQVYNPSLPQHMSLYQSFPFNSSYLACTYIEEFSLLLLNNNLYHLYPIITMRFSPNNTLQYPTYEKVVFYFFNITTGINENVYQNTQNYTLRLINCFINITLKEYNKNIEKDEVVVLNSEILSNSSQIVTYSLINSSSYEHSQCVIYNSVTYNQNITYNVIFNILTAVNGLFVLQSNKILHIVESQDYNLQLNQIEECFQSYAYYSTLYSICQNKFNQLVVISFIIYDQSIQEQQTYVIETNQIIPKQFVVLFELYFILGQINGEVDIFIFNPKNNTISILTNCKDCTYFSLTNFRNITKASEQISLIGVFYVCSSQLYYKILNYNQNTQEIIFQTRDMKLYFFKIPEIQSLMPVQVLVVKNFYSEVVLLLTTLNHFTIIISISYDFSKSQFKPQQIISSIPPYGNFTLKNSQLSNGILMNTYQNHSLSFHYTFYNLTQINIANFNIPLLMFGGSPPQDFQQLNAFFYDQQNHQGQLLLFNGSQGSIYDIIPMSIICSFNLSIFEKSEKFRYQLQAQNAFGQNGTELIFSYSRNQDNWAYGLISIVAICLILAIYTYLKKVKNLKPVNYDEEDEFEL
ncbi:unnamed protein product [Paramecium sonneborni]|uniref:Transmembrane protein n=1 Tax=Paramecium sonneborni TaxID=65129 RepID=A0A8S1N3M6_9CILI|nr:unnamed protein product [Paramecium sonneborni]